MNIHTTHIEHSNWNVGPKSPKLKNQEIHIWRVSLPIPVEIQLEINKSLSLKELTQLKKFHFKKDQERALASRGILRNILARYLTIKPKDICLNYNEFGKPYMANSNLFFNVSHAAECILYAITKEAPIGIDVELCKNDMDFLSLAKQCFSQNEYQKFLTSTPEERPLAFYRCWTRKEAVVKAIGKGLHFPLDQVEVTFLPYEEIKLLAPLGDLQKEERWKLIELFPYQNYLATIATQKNYNKICLWDWK